MIAVEIDGDNFDNIDGFYNEVHNKLCPGLDGFGRNLDALNDVLWGGFGIHEYGEALRLIWRHSQKSEKELGNIYKIIMDIIHDLGHVSLSLK